MEGVALGLGEVTSAIYPHDRTVTHGRNGGNAGRPGGLGNQTLPCTRPKRDPGSACFEALSRNYECLEVRPHREPELSSDPRTAPNLSASMRIAASRSYWPS